MMTVRVSCFASALLLGACAAHTQPQPHPPPASASRQRPGPWDHDVLIYRVRLNGVPEQMGKFERAGVATVTRLRDGRLIAAHQHFPEDNEVDFDKVAVRFSSDEGRSWGPPLVIRLSGLPDGMRFPFDPTLVVLPNGRVRLYFTSLRGQRFEEARPAIFSAISTNGVDYTFEPGLRFQIEGRPVIDCAVVLHKGAFHLYSPDNGAGGPPGKPPAGRSVDRRSESAGYHAVSRDGLQFERVDDVRSEGHRRWLGNAQSDGRSITFFGTGEGGIWMATSKDGQSWMPARTLTNLRIADPGAVTLKDRSLLVMGTGPPRPGTRSDQRPRLDAPPAERQPQ